MKNISRIVVFGDSYSDNGANLEFCELALQFHKPPKAYWLPAPPDSTLSGVAADQTARQQLKRLPGAAMVNALEHGQQIEVTKGQLMMNS